MNLQNDRNLYTHLKDIGCCDLCCLRYLGGRGSDYTDVQKSLRARKVIDDAELTACENDPKRRKANPCVACLGLFDEANILEVINTIKNSEELQKYKCNDIISSISLPIILHLRQLSIWINLLDKFSFIKKIEAPDAVAKEIFKIVINPRICEALGKEFKDNGIMANIFFTFENEDVEIQKLALIKPNVFKDRSNNKHCRKSFMTRNAFEKNFVPSTINKELYAKHIAVPPDVPKSRLQLSQITFSGPTIFVAGRYCKLSRELSQTPWVIGGKRIMEDSVQEIICSDIAPYFGVPMDKIIFSSSGREDVDVRCLGRGRPFVLELPNSFNSELPDDVAIKWENTVNKSELVSIRDLQIVSREDLVHIRTGEEFKKKQYRALCYLKNPVTLEILRKLDISEEFVINQNTPLRVLHRRPLLERPRTIHKVKAWADKTNNNVLVIDIITQAGTYIKELVHGEFGRTSPSLTSIIGEQIDIIALDVMAIDLDWPKEIIRNQENVIS